MDTLLIATDFSDSALNAANYAAALSKALKIERIILYHAYDLLPTEVDTPEIMVISSEEIYQSSLLVLEKLKRELQQIAGPGVRILARTDPQRLEDGINLLAQEYGVSLVVIGLTGKGKVERFLAGSHTSYLLRAQGLPLLVVPSGSQFEPIKRIVFASDFKAVSQTRPFRFIKEVTRGLGADLLLLNVDHREEEHFDPHFTDAQRAMHQQFDELGASFHYIDHPETETGIRSFAEAHDAQWIIAIAKSKQRVVDRLFHKSVSKKLAYMAGLPVLIIR